MQVTVHNRQKDLTISVRSLKKLVPIVLQEFAVRTDEVILQFVSMRRIIEIHEAFFQDNSPTDCMTFPIDASHAYTEGVYHLLGEVIICPKVAIVYAKTHHLDPHEETLLYVIHGLLHLFGYEDDDIASRKVMRHMEKRALDAVQAFSLKTRTLHSV